MICLSFDFWYNMLHHILFKPLRFFIAFYSHHCCIFKYLHLDIKLHIKHISGTFKLTLTTDIKIKYHLSHTNHIKSYNKPPQHMFISSTVNQQLFGVCLSVNSRCFLKAKASRASQKNNSVSFCFRPSAHLSVLDSSFRWSQPQKAEVFVQSCTLSKSWVVGLRVLKIADNAVTSKSLKECFELGRVEEIFTDLCAFLKCQSPSNNIIAAVFYTLTHKNTRKKIGTL